MSDLGFAELDGHFVAAVAQEAGTHDLAEMGGSGVGWVGPFDAAVLPDGQGFAEEEADAAER